MVKLHDAGTQRDDGATSTGAASRSEPSLPTSRTRRIASIAALSMACLFLGWCLYANRAYWRSVIEHRTLTPKQGADLSSQTKQLHRAQRPARAPFDLSNATVPVNQILSGGPPKNGIPALTNPTLIAGKEASFLRPEDRVIGFLSGKDARAYPLKVLNYHEVVNDRVGELPVAITYCPLCDSVAAFDRRTELGVREFGVSGSLYNSNVLMYDRGGRPESLWSQIKAKGISGPGANRTLDALPVELTTWKDWLSRYPDTKVLSQQTGHRRNYNRNPYAGYFSRPDLMFPVEPASNALPTKARILGVWTPKAARAYPLSAFSRQRTRVEETIDGRRIVIQFNPDANSLRVAESDAGVRWMYSLWFAWHAFRPETQIFR